MSGDDTYAPKSPDLSSFHSGPTPPSEPAEPQLFLSQQSQPNFLHLQSPASASFASSHHPHSSQVPQSRQYQLATPPQAVAQARPTHNPNGSQTASFGVGAGQHSPSQQHEYYSPRATSYPTAGYLQPNTGYQTGTPAPPPQQHASTFYQPPYRDSFQYQHYQHPHQQLPHELVAAQAQAHHPYGYSAPGGAGHGHNNLHESVDAMPPRRAAAAAAAAAVAAQTASDTAGDESLSPPPSVGASASASASAAASVVVAAAPSIEAATVKTKFPTARIKRIMQADEEVGKVAQQTPIAVGKALELFMMALVTKSADVARQRNSKRVSAQMLKQVVEGDDQWDFLRDIVGKVDGDEKGGRGASQSQGGRGKAENSDTDEEMGSGGGEAATAGAAAAVAGVKKKRGGGRKKKGQ
ncbi:hypothetical protein F5144DRAFT_165585 [Chaetomium tenue]|uniref:Uncharacterized protein n=1 Tax=Chaetomium tenue TaxID=1854479 RepID=A0ACB7PCN8_9PEZI|nr:hypothetical protein F5144DRAFT_165585 [Chaetomium globosum]